MTDFHLASGSARRFEILQSLGLSFTAKAADVDETPLAGELAEALVIRLAISKARAAGDQGDRPILGADTVVVLGDRIFGKPRSADEAIEMLMTLSGNGHQVHTAVALLWRGDCWTEHSQTDVHFREIDQDEARQYWQSGEPAGKAGAYAIQGLGGMFVRHLSGSYSGVVGLPVFETCKLLERAGIRVLAGASIKDRCKK